MDVSTEPPLGICKDSFLFDEPKVALPALRCPEPEEIIDERLELAGEESTDNDLPDLYLPLARATANRVAEMVLKPSTPPVPPRSYKKKGKERMLDSNASPLYLSSTGEICFDATMESCCAEIHKGEKKGEKMVLETKIHGPILLKHYAVGSKKAAKADGQEPQQQQQQQSNCTNVKAVAVGGSSPLRKTQQQFQQQQAVVPVPKFLGMKKRFDKLLILDLDGTLVHSEFVPRPTRDHDFTLFNDEIYVYIRPFTREFLETCLQWFELAVWTASGCEYAAEIVRHVFPHKGKELSFLFSSERCTSKYHPNGEREIIKDLKKAKRRGYPLEKMLIVDDTPSTWQRNYGNAIFIEPYWGTRWDEQLYYLLRYLERIGNEENVRVLDKRRWRDEVICATLAGLPSADIEEINNEDDDAAANGTNRGHHGGDYFVDDDGVLLGVRSDLNDDDEDDDEGDLLMRRFADAAGFDLAEIDRTIGEYEDAFGNGGGGGAPTPAEAAAAESDDEDFADHVEAGCMLWA